MIVADFDYKLRSQRFPFARTLGRPAAWATRRVAGEAGWPNQWFQLFGQRRLILVLDRRSEADVMQEALGIVESKQERADDAFALVVAETTHHAVGAAIILDFLHPGPIAGSISEIAPLGDNAVKHLTLLVELRVEFVDLGGLRL